MFFRLLSFRRSHKCPSEGPYTATTRRALWKAFHSQAALLSLLTANSLVPFTLILFISTSLVIHTFTTPCQAFHPLAACAPKPRNSLTFFGEQVTVHINHVRPQVMSNRTLALCPRCRQCQNLQALRKSGTAGYLS